MATDLTDWSNIIVQLFNCHAAGASTRGRDEIAYDPAEPAGARGTHKLFVNRGIGVVALPLMPNVVFRIAVLPVQGPIMLQPSPTWLLQHPGRLQSGDPRLQYLHVPSASLSATEVVLSCFSISCASHRLASAALLCCWHVWKLFQPQFPHRRCNGCRS